MTFLARSERLKSPPVLEYPRFDIPNMVETDSSSTAHGEVLTQEQYGASRKPVYYVSRTMNVTEKNYTAFER